MDPHSSAPPSPVAPISPDDSNLGLGILAGAVAAAAGAAAWAGITVLTNYQIGWMAVAVGALVGFAVRKAGRGQGTPFGVAGGILALVGCLAGNLLTVCIVAARQHDEALVGVLANLRPDTIGRIFSETFSPMDLLFYGLAVYEGFKFSIGAPRRA